MGGFSLWHWLVVGVILLLLFGKGRFSDMMGDVAKGIKSFKKGMTEDEEAASAPQPRIASDRPSEQPTIIQPGGERTAEPAPIVPEARSAEPDERRES